jgi:Mg2+/Co2+ transporter CorB
VSLSSAGAVLFGDILGDDEYGAAVSGAFMTVFLLLFGEISPKLLAKESSEKMACALAFPLYIMTWVMTPFCYMISLWKVLLMKVFRRSS